MEEGQWCILWIYSNGRKLEELYSSSSYMSLQLLYRVLAFSTNSFHLLLSWARVFQFGTFIFCTSFLTSSPPACLWSSCWPSLYGFPGVWPSQLSLCARMKFIMFLRFIISSSSSLVFIRHMPFSLFGPNIFLKIFLSNTNSLLIVVSFNIHVSDINLVCGLWQRISAVY